MTQPIPIFIGVDPRERAATNVLIDSLTQKFHGFVGLVHVLHAHHGILLIAQRPKLGDVAAGEHVAVHEDRPTLESHQLGHQETAEGKGGGLLGIPLSPIQRLPLQLRREHRCDRQGCAAVLHQAVNQHVGGGPLTRIHADEDRNGLCHGFEFRPDQRIRPC